MHQVQLDICILGTQELQFLTIFLHGANIYTMQKDMLAVFHHVKDRMAVHPRLIVLERQLSFLASMLGAAVLPCLPRFAPPELR